MIGRVTYVPPRSAELYYRQILLAIQKGCTDYDRSLKEFVSLPQPDMSNFSFFQNTFIVDELNYDKEDMTKQHASMLESLKTEQVGVYEEVMSAVLLQEEWFFFCMAMVVQGKPLCGEHCHVLLDLRE